MKGEGLPYCLDCRKPVRWVLNARNKWVSIDPEPVEDRTGNLHGLLAITGDDPPAVRYLWHDMQPEDHESLYASHHDTCPERSPNAAARVRAGGQGRPPEAARARALREKRKAADKGYESGLLSGQPGPCALCHRVTELVTDHCHRHGQDRDEVCLSCNSQIAKADAAFWRGDIAEIHVAHLDHLRRCERCAQELDHLLKE